MVRLAVLAGVLFSLSTITSCSQSEHAEAASKSDFKSKPEQAAYEAALEAAQHITEAIQNERAVLEAYHIAVEKAQAAQGEVSKTANAYETAKEIAIQAEEAYEDKSKEVFNHQTYLAAKEVQDEKERIYQAAIVKTAELDGYKKTNAIRAKLSVLYKEEVKAQKEYHAAKAKAKRIYEDIHARITKSTYESMMAARKSYKDAKTQWLKAQDLADETAQLVRLHTLKVNAAKAQVENARQDVYMAAALAAFKHVVEAAIAEASKPKL
ncbi:MAG: hypothetical protein OXE49_05575 [Gemmatimonadetes bacterium]|nr:hypothetical protein [Gemmatimonadota bacterium]